MTTIDRLLRYLADGPRTADEIGAFVWRDRNRGRISAVQGGGDYAAQMLLGRLRQKGLVQVAFDSVAKVTRWELTYRGRESIKCPDCGRLDAHVHCPECGSTEHGAETCDMEG